MDTEAPTSVWGLPLDWDGHEVRQYPMFVTSVKEIPADGWEYIFKSTNTGWVLIPQRSRNASDDHRQPVRPDFGGFGEG